MHMNVAEAKSKLSELLAAVDASCAPIVKEPDKHRPPPPRAQVFRTGPSCAVSGPSQLLAYRSPGAHKLGENARSFSSWGCSAPGEICSRSQTACKNSS